MALFDHKSMKDAAWSRFERRIRRGNDQDEARNVWVREVLSIDGLAVVAEWLKGKGISLHFERREGAAYFYDWKCIKISSALRPDAALILLMHECGHVLIGKAGSSKRFDMGYPKCDDPKVNKTFAHRLAVVEEETEAWFRGKKLAKKLKLGWLISGREWEEQRQSCLKSYFEWALKPKGFKEFG